MRRRLFVLALTLLVGVALAVPASAKTGDVTKLKETYSIPEDLAEVEDPGELNHGCSGGLYTLVDGTFKKKTTTIFHPSEQAWNEGADGATMTLIGTYGFRGLWDVDGDPGARFELRANNPRFEFTFDIDGSFWMHWQWKGRFIDSETGAVAEWWDFDVTGNDDGVSGVSDGTCAQLSDW